MVKSRVNVLFPYMRLWGQDVAVDLYSSCGGITKSFPLFRLTCYIPIFASCREEHCVSLTLSFQVTQ